MALWRELRDRGFCGTARQVHRWLSPRRTTRAKHMPLCEEGAPPAVPSPTTGSAPALPPPKQLAWYLTRPQDRLAAEESAAVARLEQDVDAGIVTGLVSRLANLIRSCSVSAKTRCSAPVTPFEDWLKDAQRSGVAAITAFAARLQQDGAAVKAALTTAWSNAQTEGQVGKLKMLKRQTFGRSSFDLLRRRVLLTA